MNRSKKFVCVFSGITIMGLFLLSLFVFLIDPFFHYHMPWFNLQPYAYDEIYQNPGLAAHDTYDAIIIGSSMSENFSAKWFNEAFGVNTLKLTYSGSTAENLRIAVEMAEESREEQIKYVFGNIDLFILYQDYSETRHPLPEYLYDNNVFNDVKYLLNKDVLFDDINLTIEKNRNGDVPSLTEAYSWYEERRDEFSKENALENCSITGVFEEIEQKEAHVKENVVKAVEKIRNLTQLYPNTTFQFFYSPFCMSYWYGRYAQGEFLSDVRALEYSMEELLECENVKLYFPATYEMVTDFDSYKDSQHYDLEIQYQIFEEMRDGKNRLTKENYKAYIENFTNMVLESDFEELFMS